MSKIGKVGWITLYAVMGFIDLVQILLGFTGIGAALNLAVDPYIGVLLVLYLQLRKVSVISKPLRLISIFSISIIEGVTFGIAPAWIIDVWYIRRSVKREDRKSEEFEFLQNLLLDNTKIPLISNGIRLPRSLHLKQTGRSLNVDGVRPPNGGLK